MRNLAYAMIAMMIAFFIIQGCNKVADLATLQGQLVASRTIVKINQPDTLVLVGASIKDSIKFSITPAGFGNLISQNNKAQVTFNKAGTYTVQATDNGGVPATRTITVTDSVYKPTYTTYSELPLTGDQITLTPGIYTDKLADTSYIYFTAKTTNSYCGNSVLVVGYNQDGNKFNIILSDVVQPSPCTVANGPIARLLSFTSNSPTAFSNGTYPLSVILNGVTYNGSFTATSTTIAFTWPYTSGVVLSTKQISR